MTHVDIFEFPFHGYTWAEKIVIRELGFLNHKSLSSWNKARISY